jgi:hypothetical protein
MDRPKNPAGHPDRLLECENGLETALNIVLDQFVMRAVWHGWDASEVEEAILGLVQSRRWAMLANEETSDAIDEAWEEMGGKTEH